ncbi:MAG TPA: sodium transporter [Planctomycetaceae bacterium]|nr:sodium transporter [Planctomycetaceae bacterium]
MQSPDSLLNVLDYLVIAAYLIGTVVLGLKIGAKVSGGADFFLAGRQLPWWAIGMSLVATDIGGTDIIGAGGAAYRHGLAVANFEWIGCIPAMILAAFFFIPWFYRAGVSTIPEFIELRYGLPPRIILACCWLIFMACNLGIMLLASARLMSSMLGWDPQMCILVTAGLVGIYTYAGGLAAVVYTDVLQCIVMIAGCLLVLAVGMAKVGGISGLQAAIEQAEQRRAAVTQQTTEASSTPPAPVSSATLAGWPDAAASRMSLILPADTPTPFPWPGILFGLAMILSPAYWIGNQAIVQRSLGARSEFEAQASYVWGAVLKNIIPLIVAIPGLIAFALIPDLPDGDTAIPRLVTEVLPAGARGIFIAAFLAALMSSVDSYVNSAAALLCKDLYQRLLRPAATDEQLLRIGRIATVLLVLWAILFAEILMRIDQGSGIYVIFQTLMSFFQGPAFAILLLGILWKRATAFAATVGLLSGISTAISLFALNQPAVCSLLQIRPLFRISDPFLYFSIWAFIVTVLVMVAVSLLSKPAQTVALKRHGIVP